MNDRYQALIIPIAMTAFGRLPAHMNGGRPEPKIMQLNRPIAGIDGRLLTLLKSQSTKKTSVLG
jgi:hypothetical protein